MKILLAACNAKYIHSNLAVYDLQAYASDYADHIVLKEYTINQQKDDIMRDIYLEHPDVVCVSCYIWNLSFVKELMADLIKILPGADFWAGGPEVSYDSEESMEKYQFVDYILRDEGEMVMRDLVKHFRGEMSIEDVDGIPYRQDGKIIRNKTRVLLKDLDLIPSPYENLDVKEYENRIV